MLRAARPAIDLHSRISNRQMTELEIVPNPNKTNGKGFF
jgi:hypothetical protein